MPADPAGYRFLADENFPGASVRLLRSLAYDVVAVAEVMPGLDDLGVLSIAHRDQRVLLTFDRDHGYLVFAAGAPVPPGIIHFRITHRRPEDPALYLLALMSNAESSVIGNDTVIRDEDRVAQRLLPEG